MARLHLLTSSLLLPITIAAIAILHRLDARVYPLSTERLESEQVAALRGFLSQVGLEGSVEQFDQGRYDYLLVYEGVNRSLQALLAVELDQHSHTYTIGFFAVTGEHCNEWKKQKRLPHCYVISWYDCRR